MIDVHQAFPAEYAIDSAPDIALPAESHAFMPAESWAVGTDIPVGFRVQNARRWVGYFRTDLSRVPESLSAVSTLPHSMTACVVAGGMGYVVDVDNPENFLVVQVGGPVVGLLSAVDLPGILLLTRHDIAAVGGNGVVWRSAYLSDDGYVVDEVAEGRIVGRLAPKYENLPFALDLKTGLKV